MRVRDEQCEVQRLVFEFVEQRLSQRAQSGAAIENQDVLAATHFDARRITAIADSVGPRTGNTPADAPKSNAHVKDPACTNGIGVRHSISDARGM